MNESKAEVLNVFRLLSAAVLARSSESVEAGISALVKVSAPHVRAMRAEPGSGS